MQARRAAARLLTMGQAWLRQQARRYLKQGRLRHSETEPETSPEWKMGRTQTFMPFPIPEAAPNPSWCTARVGGNTMWGLGKRIGASLTTQIREAPYTIPNRASKHDETLRGGWSYRCIT